MKKFLFILLLGFVSISAYSQIQKNTNPPSFSKANLSARFDIETMPTVDVVSLLAQDAYNESHNVEMPWRFGHNIETDINMDDYGSWEFLRDGSAIWRLGIQSQGAFSLNLGFSKFWMPRGAELYIYSADKSQVLGAFTSENNSIDSVFSTLLIQGDKIVVEYYQPASVQTQAIINIDKVTHAYKDAFAYAKTFGQAGSCMINTACTQGIGWEDQVRSVCMIVVNGNGFCTGTLVNNTSNNGTPYILTGDHCYTNPSTWVFWFNWESATCTNPSTAPSEDAISGSVLVARESQSDFCLVQMNSTPPASYNVFYSGWDRTASVPTSTTTIHHPNGDIKKISIDNNAPVSDYYYGSGGLIDSHWKIVAWDNGSVDYSSGGAGLWDPNNRLIGIYHGGYGSCTNTGSSWFGKFSTAWNTGTTAATRLSDWLDPTSIGTTTNNGFDPNNVVTSLDVRPYEMLEPQSSYCGHENSISPQIVIQNMGTTTLTSANVNCRIGISGTPITIAWTGSLAQSAKDTIQFPAMSVNSGVFTFYAYTDSPNGGTDVLMTNDTINLSVDNGGNTYPFTEDFETFYIGTPGVFVNNWISTSADNFEWYVDSDGTPTGSTGPAADHTQNNAAGIYLFTESSEGTTGSTANLESYCIDLTDANNPKVSFWYHMYGSSMGSLHLDVNVNGVWTNSVWSRYGQQHSSSSDPWTQAVVDISAYAGNGIQLRLRGVRGGGARGDMAIDDIYVWDDYTTPTPNDAGITEIINPENIMCGETVAVIPQVVLKNYGTVTLTNVTIKYSINGGTAVNYSWTGSLITGQKDTVDLAAVIIPLGVSSFTAYTSAPNSYSDGNLLNDTVNKGINNYGFTAPYIETFETFTVGTPGTLNNGWTSEKDATMVWTVDNGGTLTGYTGPTVDHTLGTSSGIYLFSESTSSINGEECRLVSPCIDLDTLQNPTLVFWYHMYGFQVGSLTTDVYINNSWVQINNLSGSQQTNQIDPWLSDTIDLSSYVGQKIQLRFRATSLGQGYSDMAIDDVEIFDDYTPPTPNDIGISEVIDPSSLYCNSIATITPSVVLENFGTSILLSATIEYTIDAGTAVSYSWTGSLAPGAKDTIALSSFTLTLGTLSFNAYTLNPNGGLDGNSANDNTQIIISNYGFGIPSIETCETFTVGNYGSLYPGIFENGWISTADQGYQWYVDNDKTPTGAWDVTGPSVDHTLGTTAGIYLYTEASGVTTTGANPVAQLTSPCIDLTTSTQPHLEFWYHKFGGNMGDLSVDIFYNNTWINGVFTIAGQTHTTNTDPWLSADIDLTTYAGSTIQVRFNGAYGSGIEGDMAIDDIRFYETYFPPIPDDASIIEILEPYDDYCLELNPVAPRVILQNVGTTNLTTASISYEYNSGSVLTYNWTGNLSTSQTDTVTLTASVMPTSNSVLTVYSSLPNGNADLNTYNDTLSKSVSNSGLTAPFTEDFETFTVGVPGTYDNGWENDASGTRAWYVDNAGTPTNNTGPTADHTLGTNAGQYLFTEASGLLAADEFLLVTPCIKLDTLVNPHLSFWYYMFGQQMGSLEIDIYANNTWTNSIISFSGQQQTANTDPWLEEDFDLTSYAGQTITLRFRGIRGNGNRADIAIDDIGIYEAYIPPSPNDIGVIEIIEPENVYCGTTNPITPQLVIYNFGTIALTSAQINYDINGGTIVSSNWTGNLAPNNSDTITLSPTALPIGSVVFSAFTSNPNSTTDGNINNDSSTVNITNYVITAPTTEDFETFVVGTPGTTANSWSTESVDDFQWYVDSDGTPSNGTGPDTDHTLGTAAGIYMFTEATNLTAGEASLISPCIDVSSLQNPEFEFWYHRCGTAMGDLSIDIYSNGVWTNDILTLTGAQQTATSDPWLDTNVNIAAYGSQIRIRFRATYGGSWQGDMAIDDINIYNNVAPPTVDFQIDKPITCVGVTTNIQNLCSGATSFEWTITPNTFTYVNSTSSTHFSPNVEFNAAGLYDIKLVASNTYGIDSLTKTAHVEIIGNGIFPFSENFESGSFTTNNWAIVNDDNSTTWEISTTASGLPQSTASAYIENYNYNSTGTTDTLKSTVIDLTQTSIDNPRLFFKHAYGPYQGYADTLKVAVSTDCGFSWTTIWAKGGNELSSAGTVNQAFTPSAASDWAGDTIDLLAYDGNSIQLAFINVNGYSNNIYIDNINVINALQTPVTAFSISADTICPGELVYFTDNSTNTPSQWNWTFEGADTIYSSYQNPSTTWTVPGTYNVSLSAANSGGTDTYTYTNAIVVLNAPIAYAGTDQTICEGEFAILNAGGGTSYAWSNNGGSSSQAIVNPTINTTYTVSVSDGICWGTDQVTVIVNLLPTADAGLDQISCVGADVTLNASGGSSYLWSTGSLNNSIIVSPTVDTSYYLTVTDNGCSNFDTVNVTMVTEPPADAGIDQSICIGSTAILTASGGDTYIWSNGLTGQTIGVSPTITTSYIVTVSIGGVCSATDTVDVIIITNITADAGMDVSICEGDNVQLIANGGDNYMWSDGQINDTIYVSPTTTTTYSVTVSLGTSGNCIDFDDVEVTVKPKPTADAGVDQFICEGEYATFNANGGSTYQWNNGVNTQSITVLEYFNTYYTVTVTDTNGCTDTDDVMLSVNQTQYVDLGPDTTICKNQYLVINVPGTGWSSYLWSSGLTQNYAYIDYNTSGLGAHPIWLNVTDTNGCPSNDTIVVTIDDCVGIGEFDILSNLSIYPNPARTSITISYNLANDNNLVLDIFDAKGSLALSRGIKSNIGEHSETINVKNFPSGIYYIKISGNEFIRTEKLIIE